MKGGGIEKVFTYLGHFILMLFIGKCHYSGGDYVS